MWLMLIYYSEGIHVWHVSYCYLSPKHYRNNVGVKCNKWWKFNGEFCIERLWTKTKIFYILAYGKIEPKPNQGTFIVYMDMKLICLWQGCQNMTNHWFNWFFHQNRTFVDCLNKLSVTTVNFIRSENNLALLQLFIDARSLWAHVLYSEHAQSALCLFANAH